MDTASQSMLVLPDLEQDKVLGAWILQCLSTRLAPIFATKADLHSSSQRTQALAAQSCDMWQGKGADNPANQGCHKSCAHKHKSVDRVIHQIIK